ncbi:MAG: GspE/PulE family protein, partial [Candidatus Marinimicrobia bacterium]|nr:GspE/PulE family protein [Candidatus Neomarinimicrobiota bacterium]
KPVDPQTLLEVEGTLHDDKDVMKSILGEMEDTDQNVEIVNSFDLAEDAIDGDEAPIIKLLNVMLLQAIRENASDIHIEAEENVTRVRYRVDGELREAMHPPKRFHIAIVSRVKIMSDLDIAEKRAPQDGRMRLKIGDVAVDVRVSTLPSVYGEKVVLRVLQSGSSNLNIEDLGFTEQQIQTYRSIVNRPYGIVLVTGPTGSGKTTTLYSTLRFLNTMSKNIITIEDPVEYQMENINQIQVNRKAGIDFSTGLKSILRQDPDIIMVGEMRDEETASVAIKAALTGHLVLSTLHTNDAPSCYERLQAMRIAPYLLASAISGVIRQRLVKNICTNCKVPCDPDVDSIRLMKLRTDVQYYKGEGCNQCGGTGLRGRSALYEILTPSQEVKKRILTGNLIEGCEIPGFARMIDHGRIAIEAGITTAEEVLKVVRLQEVH